jgi:hypothetical protein
MRIENTGDDSEMPSVSAITLIISLLFFEGPFAGAFLQSLEEEKYEIHRCNATME